MSIFKRTIVQKKQTRRAARELSSLEAQLVGGGLNPQPLPPFHRPETNRW